MNKRRGARSAAVQPQSSKAATGVKSRGARSLTYFSPAAANNPAPANRRNDSVTGLPLKFRSKSASGVYGIDFYERTIRRSVMSRCNYLLQLSILFSLKLIILTCYKHHSGI